MKYKKSVTMALFIEQSFEGFGFEFFFFSCSLLIAPVRDWVAWIAGRCDCKFLMNLGRLCVDE